MPGCIVPLAVASKTISHNASANPNYTGGGLQKGESVSHRSVISQSSVSQQYQSTVPSQQYQVNSTKSTVPSQQYSTRSHVQSFSQSSNKTSRSRHRTTKKKHCSSDRPLTICWDLSPAFHLFMAAVALVVMAPSTSV
jgi:hypothetical protein